MVIDKPLTQIKNFFEKVEELDICGSAQLVYLHIFMIFNKNRFPETMRIKDSEIRESVRLYDSNGKPASIDTIRRAKQRLISHGLIEVELEVRGITKYRLIPLYDSVESKPQAVEELSDEVRHAWIRANGENPFGGYVEDLITRQKRYGAKAVSEAIERCRKKRTFGDLISMNFLDSELMKGGEQNGKVVSIRASGRNGAVVSEYTGAWDFADELPPED